MEAGEEPERSEKGKGDAPHDATADATRIGCGPPSCS
jgi:hypothetical protein